VAQTKSPVLIEVTRAVGNAIREIRECVQVRTEFFKGHDLMNRNRVVDDMQVMFLKVNHSPPGFILDKSIDDVPFLWNRPVEHLRARANLGSIKRNRLTNDVERPTDPVTRDTATDRVEALDERIHLLADV
jgi:hypothetical protein